MPASFTYVGFGKWRLTSEVTEAILTLDGRPDTKNRKTTGSRGLLTL